MQILITKPFSPYFHFKEFHLEYDKLEERPHVPTTFNYNPAQQAFWTGCAQALWAAGTDLSTRLGQPQSAFIPHLSGQGLQEEGRGSLP